MEFPPGEASFARTFSLQPLGDQGAFEELAVTLEEGEGITYAWTADRTIDFNIHSHEEKRVTFHEQVRGKAHQGQFQGPQAGAYYLMWQNASDTPVEVRIQAER